MYITYAKDLAFLSMKLIDVLQRLMKFTNVCKFKTAQWDCMGKEPRI